MKKYNFTMSELLLGSLVLAQENTPPAKRTVRSMAILDELNGNERIVMHENNKYLKLSSNKFG